MPDDMFDRPNVRAIRAAEEMAATARDDLRPFWRIVAAGMARGARYGDMVKDAVAKGHAQDVAEKIVNTLLALANSRGALQGLFEAEAIGVKVQKQWLDAPGACDACASNARQGGVGLRLPFRSGHLTPPAHIGCRCCLTSFIAD
jgi:hypothetical protein